MAEQYNAYDVMEKVAEYYGYRGINPEFLMFLRDQVSEDGDFPAVAGYWSNLVRWAYNKVMADARAMFAPA